MFHIKLHTNNKTNHSANWHDFFSNSKTDKRVITKTHTTAYHPQKLGDSIHKICMKSFGYSGEAETTAIHVCVEIEKWLKDKEEVTSNDIKRKAAEALQKYNPRAAYKYFPVKQLALQKDQYGFIRL